MIFIKEIGQFLPRKVTDIGRGIAVAGTLTAATLMSEVGISHVEAYSNPNFGSQTRITRQNGEPSVNVQPTLDAGSNKRRNPVDPGPCGNPPRPFPFCETPPPPTPTPGHGGRNH